MNIRRATHDDYEDVAAFTSEIWADRGGDYIPGVYHEWLEDELGRGKKTFLAEIDGDAAGIVQAVMLSPDEAWFQSMRVASDYRRQGVSRRLNEACFEWAREQGATVGRVMIFSWNTASLAAARACGFEPVTEFRFAHPEPVHDPGTGSSFDSASGDDAYTVSNDPDAAWRYWTHSDARDHLRGLGLDPEETWAMRELTRSDFEQFADETCVLAVAGPDGLAGAAYRTRTYERPADDADDDEESDTDTEDVDEPATETWAEYGVGAWDDPDAARTLFVAIARDAADCGADRTRVLIPESTRFVTDAAVAGADLADEPDFVLGIDLARDRSGH